MKPKEYNLLSNQRMENRGCSSIDNDLLPIMTDNCSIIFRGKKGRIPTMINDLLSSFQLSPFHYLYVET